MSTISLQKYNYVHNYFEPLEKFMIELKKRIKQLKNEKHFYTFVRNYIELNDDLSCSSSKLKTN